MDPGEEKTARERRKKPIPRLRKRSGRAVELSVLNLIAMPTSSNSSRNCLLRMNNHKDTRRSRLVDARRMKQLPIALGLMSLLACAASDLAVESPPSVIINSPVHLFALNPDHEYLECWYVVRDPEGKNGFACFSGSVDTYRPGGTGLMATIEEFGARLRESAMNSSVRRVILLPHYRDAKFAHGYVMRPLSVSEIEVLLSAHEKVSLDR